MPWPAGPRASLALFLLLLASPGTAQTAIPADDSETLPQPPASALTLLAFIDAALAEGRLQAAQDLFRVRAPRAMIRKCGCVKPSCYWLRA
jgi:hypothetical protein